MAVNIPPPRWPYWRVTFLHVRHGTRHQVTIAAPNEFRAVPLAQEALPQRPGQPLEAADLELYSVVPWDPDEECE